MVSLTEQKILLLSKPKENKDRKKRDRARSCHSVCSAHLQTGKCVKLRYGKEAKYFLTSGHERVSGLPDKFENRISVEDHQWLIPAEELRYCFQSLVNNLKMCIAVSQL